MALKSLFGTVEENNKLKTIRRKVLTSMYNSMKRLMFNLRLKKTKLPHTNTIKDKEE